MSEGSIVVELHAFNRAVDTTMRRRKALSDQRGGEYRDTWARANVKTAFLDAALDAVRVRGSSLSVEEKRLLIVAALCDVKVSRLIGGYKDDTLLDLGNYLDAFAEWMREYDA